MSTADRLAVNDLLERRRISREDLARATERADLDQTTLGDALLAIDAVSSREWAIARARVRECPFVDLAAFEIDPSQASLLPGGLAHRLGAFPLFVIDGIATVAMVDPLDLHAVDQVRHALRMEVDPVVCDPAELMSLLDADPLGDADTGQARPATLQAMGAAERHLEWVEAMLGRSAGLVLLVGPDHAPLDATARAVAAGREVGVRIEDIRDAASARLAVDAVLSGQLVVATIAAADAGSAVARLRNFGLRASVIGQALVGVLAERRMGRVCASCREPAGDLRVPLLGAGVELPPEASLVRGAGCAACGGRGVAGSLCVFDTLTIGDALARAIAADLPLRTFGPEASGVSGLLAHAAELAAGGEIPADSLLSLAHQLGAGRDDTAPRLSA